MVNIKSNDPKQIWCGVTEPQHQSVACYSLHSAIFIVNVSSAITSVITCDTPWHQSTSWASCFLILCVFSNSVCLVSPAHQILSKCQTPCQAQETLPERRQTIRSIDEMHFNAFSRTDTRGAGVSLPSLDKQMTGNDRLWESTSARPDGNQRAGLQSWQPFYRPSSCSGGNSYAESALHLCHFEQTAPPNTR